MARDDKVPNPKPADIKTLHMVYTVTNIQNKIRPLDSTTITYSAWVKLFRLHLKVYKVLDHIEGDPPTADDPVLEKWHKINALIVQWIYCTVNLNILARILEDDTTAHEAWSRIKVIFLCNKQARAYALEHKFTNTTLPECCGLNPYCKILKEIAGKLGDLEQPVSEARLVMQMVRGLPRELDTVVNSGSPSWEVARDMIHQEQRQAARSKHLNVTNK
ncbi:uncharacterized protein LOC143602751 [Bidens hawaiensis]|uniref:uncharacterized protein LOC143602751 n=1 Tax=Bidens hawaiensis TaxID=980011 RepID=UPI0040492142